MSISVGDFAEQILAQEQQQASSKVAPPSFESDPSFYSPEVGNQIDISEVEVPDDFINSIMEGKAPVVPLTEGVTPKTEAIPNAVPSTQNQDLWNIMEEVKQLLIQVKETLTEMTTVGALGVNLANNTEQPKKKEDEEEDAMMALLKKINKKRRAAKR
jgi:hypothetical protein|tara:strand:- start:300 stop:773 length:474 start_codon:yes stop_codon:yes gene_type:complete